MAASLHQASPASLAMFYSPRQSLHYTRPSFLLYSRPSSPSFSLFATSPTSILDSSPPIFLPLLEKAEKEEKFIEDPEAQITEQEREGEEEEVDEKEEEEEDIINPILRFFKTQTSTQNPTRHGKLSLQNNRRSSWRLAPNFNAEPGSDIEDVPVRGETRQIYSTNTEGTNPRLLPEGIAGEIMQIYRNLPENSTLGECLGGYERRISAKECVEVLGLMGKEGMVMGCLHFFEWMGQQEPSLVTPRAYTVLFPLLGRMRMSDNLKILFRNMPQSNEFRDVHVYNAAISGLLCSGRYDDAFKLYGAMEMNNVSPDHVTCSIMITVMRKSGRSAKEAWEFFEKMNRKGVNWSPEVLGALVKLFCDEGLTYQALTIQSEMEKKGISSNAIVYNTLMDAYGKSNLIDEAEGLFYEMKTKGLKPTTATFNILMDAYSRRMQPEIVEKLLLEMQDAGLEPNAKSYTCLISAYGRQKKMSDMAADAFLRMKKVGIKPTSHSYTALIHAYSLGGWHEKAYVSFENMHREGIKPSIETYTALLDAFRRAGDTQTLMKIWKLMRSDKVEGTRVTFNILLDGFAKQGHYIEARDVISEFGKLGMLPTVMTYNMLMNAYARGGSHSKLPQLLKEMATLSLKPDSSTYMTMIYAYIRVRDFRRAFFYHKQMVKCGQVPDARSYEKLRTILNAKATSRNKKDKRAMLGIITRTMGLFKVRKKGKKDPFWKKKKKRLKLRNIVPEGHVSL
uniref:Uncharacterized protein MANES_06G113500 n=1 Tax=Rhizophora mucronata TaxID=61149 RepID=A0A2P2J9F6_RHIMU